MLATIDAHTCMVKLTVTDIDSCSRGAQNLTSVEAQCIIEVLPCRRLNNEGNVESKTTLHTNRKNRIRCGVQGGRKTRLVPSVRRPPSPFDVI